MSTQTILVGARPIFREGLALILTQAGYEVVAATATAEGALKASAPLVVLDAANDPHVTIAEITVLHTFLPEARIALVVGNGQLDPSHIMACFKAGMHAYMVNPSSEIFIKSLELIMLGQMILPGGTFMELPRREPPKRREASDLLELSVREKEVLRHVADGQSNKQIARLIDAAETTVKVHVKSILRKLRVVNRTQAAMWAANNLPVSNGHAVEIEAIGDEIRVGE